MPAVRRVRAAVRSVLVLALVPEADFFAPAAALLMRAAGAFRLGAASAAAAPCSAVALAAMSMRRDLRLLALRRCRIPCSAALSSADVARLISA